MLARESQKDIDIEANDSDFVNIVTPEQSNVVK